jgi:hypothetical protein
MFFAKQIHEINVYKTDSSVRSSAFSPKLLNGLHFALGSALKADR